MADLGTRANVMGPQPIGVRKVDPPEMYDAAGKFLDALMRGDKAAALAMTDEQAHGQVTAIADSFKAGAYTENEIFGKARVVKHYYVKGRLKGPGGAQASVQFRIGAGDDGRWTVREAINLTAVRSGWTK
jgi:hypothetical protein